MTTSNNKSGETGDPGADHWGIRLLMALARIAIYLPWIWLALFAVFVLVVALQQGQLPSYGQPDPKDAGTISILYYPVIVLLLTVMATIPIGLGLAIVRLMRGVPPQIRSGEAVAYLAGVALILLLTISDFAGLMTWLGD